jgi:putative hemolysin
MHPIAKVSAASADVRPFPIYTPAGRSGASHTAFAGRSSGGRAAARRGERFGTGDRILAAMHITIEILVLGLLLVANGIFAMSEIAVVASRKARLQQRASRGDERSRRALELANDPNRFLSTVQIGITTVGVLAGAFGGATVAQQLAAWLDTVPALARYAQVLGIGIVVAVITFATLVIGELVPKRIALTRPERIAARIAGPMHRLSRLATPLVRLLGGATNLVLRMLPDPPADDPAVTEEDVRLLLEQGTRAGVFLAAEQNIVENVFWLADQRVENVMTPRDRIVWLDVNADAEQHRRIMLEQPQARYVLGDGALDRVVGAVAVQSMWPRALRGDPLDTANDATMPLFVPAGTRALTLLEQFRQTRVHMALVQDVTGQVTGLVTMTDILEGLVGELAEYTEDDIVQRADGSWLLSPGLRMSAVCDLLGLDASGDARTGSSLGDFVTAALGDSPAAADYFEWAGHRFEVVDMDGPRVDKVLVAAVGPNHRGERSTS